MTIAMLNFAIAVIVRTTPMAGLAWRPFALVAAALVTGLALERLAAGISAARRFRDPTPLVFPLLHLARDLAWVTAIAMWSARRIGGHPPKPSHSMRQRPEPVFSMLRSQVLFGRVAPRRSAEASRYNRGM